MNAEANQQARCLECLGTFTKQRKNQRYDKPQCRKAAGKRRARASVASQAKPRILDPGRLLTEATGVLERAGRPPLRSDPGLNARAALLLAELRLAQATKALEQARADAGRTPCSYQRRERHVLRVGEPLPLALTAEAVGIAADAESAVVVFGFASDSA